MRSGFTNVTDGLTDRQTDRQTDGRHVTAIPLHCYIAWSGKKVKKKLSDDAENNTAVASAGSKTIEHNMQCVK